MGPDGGEAPGVSGPSHGHQHGFTGDVECVQMVERPRYLRTQSWALTRVYKLKPEKPRGDTTNL